MYLQKYLREFNRTREIKHIGQCLAQSRCSVSGRKFITTISILLQSFQNVDQGEILISSRLPPQTFPLLICQSPRHLKSYC